MDKEAQEIVRNMAGERSEKTPKFKLANSKWKKDTRKYLTDAQHQRGIMYIFAGISVILTLAIIDKQMNRKKELLEIYADEE